MTNFCKFQNRIDGVVIFFKNQVNVKVIIQNDFFKIPGILKITVKYF